MASVSIEERSEISFTVTFNGTSAIDTTVTAYAEDVEAWLADTLRIHGTTTTTTTTLVGLDVEWRPSYSRIQNPVAVLQLCIAQRCLVFLLKRSDSVPKALFDFLRDRRFTFVGVGIGEDVDKIIEDHDLVVGNMLDLRELAVERTGRPEMKQMGLAGLAMQVMGVAVDKPKTVTMSRWDNIYLSHEQIKYASVDAFLSYEIGRKLMAREF